MSDLSDVLQRLASGRAYVERLQAAVQPFGSTSHLQTSLREVEGFGSNPGALRMFLHVPDGARRKAPLVVVLHGCGQTAGDYAEGAGWLALADAHHFAVLAPEQQAANNPKTCFNWFQRGDTSAGAGEAESIRQMIERAVADHGFDRKRIFVTGLSAGGAMTAAMLALHPDLFAAGAIIAGLPFRAATDVPEAFEAMFRVRARSARDQGDLVRGAVATPRVWPRVSIWQGDADTTVVPGNAEELVKQWTNVHGLDRPSTTREPSAGVRLRRWTQGGNVVVEEVRLAGVTHGTPIGATPTAGPQPYMLDVGIASSDHIAQFFGLVRNAGSMQLRPSRASDRPTSGSLRPSNLVARMMRSMKPHLS